MLHRDIKPSNLRVTPEGRLKILDFGLARVVRSERGEGATVTVTEAGVVSGTVPYMSPEQLRGEGLDERTDVWSAGAVLYELAVGRRPFAGETQAQLIAAILQGTPAAPRELNSNVSAELERIALRCLEKDPDLRYQSARDLEAELKWLQAPSGATRVAVSGRRRGRSSRVLVGGAVTAAILVVITGLLALDVGGLREWVSGGGDSGASLAVLPLADLSGDSGQAHLRVGRIIASK